MVRNDAVNLLFTLTRLYLQAIVSGQEAYTWEYPGDGLMMQLKYQQTGNFG